MRTLLHEDKNISLLLQSQYFMNIYIFLTLKWYWLRDNKYTLNKIPLLAVKRTIGEIEARGGGPVNIRLG